MSRRFSLGLVQRAVQRLCPIQRRPATFARFQMLVNRLLFLERQFSIEEKRKQALDPIATHTNSPSATLIFCVTRKRQFLAACSVVPSTSPMAFRRRPW